MEREIIREIRAAQIIAALLNLNEPLIIMHVSRGALDAAIESILPDLRPDDAALFEIANTPDGRRCIRPFDIATVMADAGCALFAADILSIQVNPPFAHILLHEMGFSKLEERQRLSEQLIAALRAATEALEERENPAQRRVG